MFILDTNVVSELMQERPHPMVLEWLDDRLARDLFVTAVTRNVRDFEGTGVAVVNPWEDV